MDPGTAIIPPRVLSLWPKLKPAEKALIPIVASHFRSEESATSYDAGACARQSQRVYAAESGLTARAVRDALHALCLPEPGDPPGTRRLGVFRRAASGGHWDRDCYWWAADAKRGGEELEHRTSNIEQPTSNGGKTEDRGLGTEGSAKTEGKQFPVRVGSGAAELATRNSEFGIRNSELGTSEAVDRGPRTEDSGLRSGGCARRERVGSAFAEDVRAMVEDLTECLVTRANAKQAEGKQFPVRVGSGAIFGREEEENCKANRAANRSTEGKQFPVSEGNGVPLSLTSELTSESCGETVSGLSEGKTEAGLKKKPNIIQAPEGKALPLSPEAPSVVGQQTAHFLRLIESHSPDAADAGAVAEYLRTTRCRSRSSLSLSTFNVAAWVDALRTLGSLKVLAIIMRAYNDHGIRTITGWLQKAFTDRGKEWTRTSEEDERNASAYILAYRKAHAPSGAVRGASAG
jgi:hypothetical protein